MTSTVASNGKAVVSECFLPLSGSLVGFCDSSFWVLYCLVMLGEDRYFELLSSTVVFSVSPALRFSVTRIEMFLGKFLVVWCSS